MASWDRSKPTYIEEWVPRFVPYHTELVQQVGLGARQRVLVVSSGPGALAVAAARAVGENGNVHALDPNKALADLTAERARISNVHVDVGQGTTPDGGLYDAILCAFGDREIDIASVLHAWGDALAPQGKLGLLSWGPTEPDDPLSALEMILVQGQPPVSPDRAALQSMLASAGLALVRHTLVRHTVTFPTAEALARATCASCSWSGEFLARNEAVRGKLLAKFYDSVGGPAAPIAFQPVATLAIAAHPGAEIELPHRPSVRVPKAT